MLHHTAHRAAQLAALALLVLVSGCSGPCFLMPGGELEGEAVPPPLNWGFAGEYGMAQLETRPDEPYSVNLAYTIVDEVLYINAGDTETQWAKNMSVDPHVRLGIDGQLFALRAERVTDPGEIARFGEAWTSQSLFRRDPTELEEVWLYRLVPR